LLADKQVGPQKLHALGVVVYVIGIRDGKELGFETRNANNESGDYKNYLELGRFISTILLSATWVKFDGS